LAHRRRLGSGRHGPKIARGPRAAAHSDCPDIRLTGPPRARYPRR
jgi:hypothetical protein